MAELEVTRGPAAGQVLKVDGDVSVGRGVEVEVQLEDPAVSRKHFALSRDESGRYVLEDLESHNGTYVNRTRVYRCVLSEGDEIRAGKTTMIFHAEPESEAVRLAEATRIDVVAEASTSVVNTLPLETLDIEKGAEQIARTALPGTHRSLRLVCEIFRRLGMGLREEPVLQRILDMLFRIFPDTERGFIVLRDPESGALTPAATKTLGRGGENTLALSRVLLRHVLEKKQSILTRDAIHDGRFESSETIRDLGIRSVMCAPLMQDDKVLGFISLDTQRVSPSYDRDGLALLGAIANVATLAISNARLHSERIAQERLDQDLRNAQRIQHSFLPQAPPSLPGYDFADWYSAAQEVGGDFYDFIELPGGKLAVTIGDVSGKGITAALLMAKLMGQIRFLAALELAPAELLARLNRYFVAPETDAFVTLLYIVLHPESDRLVIGNAGHHSPLVRLRDAKVQPVRCEPALPVGVVEDASFPQVEFRFGPQDRLCVFTDGIVEAMNEENEAFGQQRLEMALAESGPAPQSMLESVQQRVWEHMGSSNQSDDLTLVCFGPADGALD